MPKDSSNTVHLGDGLYAHYTGYSIEFSVNDHRNPVVATMELPFGLEMLNRFVEEQKEKHG